MATMPLRRFILSYQNDGSYCEKPQQAIICYMTDREKECIFAAFFQQMQFDGRLRDNEVTNYFTSNSI
jgi:hypothetical protein